MILSESANLFFLEKKKMNPKNRNRMTFLSILAAIIIFACQASGAAPTATPNPTTQ